MARAATWRAEGHAWVSIGCLKVTAIGYVTYERSVGFFGSRTPATREPCVAGASFDGSSSPVRGGQSGQPWTTSRPCFPLSQRNRISPLQLSWSNATPSAFAGGNSQSRVIGVESGGLMVSSMQSRKPGRYVAASSKVARGEPLRPTDTMPTCSNPSSGRGDPDYRGVSTFGRLLAESLEDEAPGPLILVTAS